MNKIRQQIDDAMSGGIAEAREWLDEFTKEFLAGDVANNIAMTFARLPKEQIDGLQAANPVGFAEFDRKFLGGKYANKNATRMETQQVQEASPASSPAGDISSAPLPRP